MKSLRSFPQVLTVTAAALLLSFSAYAQDEHAAHKEKDITKAIAVLVPTKDSKVAGTVTFTKTIDGVNVEATLTGLAPGKHGFHIHQFGDTSSPDGKAAGDHFNPAGNPHAAPDAGKRHVGDLGNIEADASGTAKYSLLDKQLKFDGANCILGRSVVVHEKADDLKTQPTGDAGARVAVGVIGAAKSE